jgi:flagellar biosynthesis protein
MVDIFDNNRNPEGPNIKPVRRSKDEVERAVAVAIENFAKDGKDISKITASGYGLLAEQILALAFQNDVKVREDRDLAQMLSAVELDSEIPADALIAVAEILAYVYRVNGEYNRANAVEENARHDPK